jgi:YegS/Rv2252/BmrU family lipid kinase
MRSLTILNPAAGRGRARDVWERLRRQLEERGETPRVHVTRARGEALGVTRMALQAGVERIYVVGGDGTFNEALNGYFFDGVALNPTAVLVAVAAGTGCDLVRSLALSAAPDGFIQMDVGRLSCVGASGEEVVRYFANVASCGQSARVAETVARMPRWFGGGGAYLLAILGSLRSYQPALVELTIDGVRAEPQPARCIAVANGRAFGGGLTIAPQARVDSGVLDLAVLGAASPGWLLRNVCRIYRGEHDALAHLSHRSARSVTVTSGTRVAIEADGEPAGELPASFEVLAGSVRVALPEQLLVG